MGMLGIWVDHCHMSLQITLTPRSLRTDTGNGQTIHARPRKVWPLTDEISSVKFWWPFMVQKGCRSSNKVFMYDGGSRILDLPRGSIWKSTPIQE